MTRYETGFLRRCAERGVDGRPILAKMAQAVTNAQQAASSAPAKTPKRRAARTPAAKRTPTPPPPPPPPPPPLPSVADSGASPSIVYQHADRMGVGMHDPLHERDLSEMFGGAGSVTNGHGDVFVSDNVARDLAQQWMLKYLSGTTNGASQRLPTPFELNQFRDYALRDGSVSPEAAESLGALGDKRLRNALAGAVLDPGSEYADRVLRTIWNTATNSAPAGTVVNSGPSGGAYPAPPPLLPPVTGPASEF